jgi:hypothetical protein
MNSYKQGGQNLDKDRFSNRDRDRFSDRVCTTEPIGITISIVTGIWKAVAIFNVAASLAATSSNTDGISVSAASSTAIGCS